MNGDEVDRRGELTIAQPELPYIRIGDRHFHSRLHLADDVAERLGGQFAAQQHLVADHDGLHHVRVAVGEIDRGLDLVLVEDRIRPEPDPQQAP